MKFKFSANPANRRADQGEAADGQGRPPHPHGDGFAQDSQRFAQDSHAESLYPCGPSRDSQDSHDSRRAHTAEHVAELDRLIVYLCQLEAPWLEGFLPAMQDARRHMAPIQVSESLASFQRWVAEAEARATGPPRESNKRHFHHPHNRKDTTR